MTEKRLIVNDDYAWVDTVTDIHIEIEDAFDLVNELWEEIGKLEQKIQAYHKGQLGLANYNIKLVEENEELKKEYSKLKHRHSLLHDVCVEAECDRDGYHKDVLSLEKENEQLKKELYQIDKLIEDLGHEEMKRQYEEIYGDK